MNGYDGQGHDNLVWLGEEMAYTLHNKLILEHTKTRAQTVFTDSLTLLSTVALSRDRTLLAVAEGTPSPSGNSHIYLYNLQQKSLIHKYTFH